MGGRRLLWAALLLAVGLAAHPCCGGRGACGAHSFHRGWAARRAGGGRRVFGGAAVAAGAAPAACALLDRWLRVRCSCAALAPRWALSAAHCLSARAAYVAHHTARPQQHDARVAAVLRLYRHPGYEVQVKDEGHGLDVTRLQHDVGLVRTRHDILDPADGRHALGDLARYGQRDLLGEEVEVLGFGVTGQWSDERLYAVRLRLVPCARGGWRHCVCAVSPIGADARGVCAGDSGGPVLYRGRQVGVTSLGPAECGAGGGVSRGATSVLTWLQPYAAIINHTLRGADRELRMRIVAAAPPAAPPAAGAPLVLALVAAATAVLFI